VKKPQSKRKAKAKEKLPEKTYLDLVRDHCDSFEDFVQSEVAGILFQELGQLFFDYGFDEEEMNKLLNLIARPIWLMARKM
jgi:hypothetical protein